MDEVSRGGARGLQVLSLSECKSITDAGVAHLFQLQYLSKIVLLGCMNIKDQGVRDICRTHKYL